MKDKENIIIYEMPEDSNPKTYVIGIDPYQEENSDKVNNLGEIEIIKEVLNIK